MTDYDPDAYRAVVTGQPHDHKKLGEAWAYIQQRTVSTFAPETILIADILEHTRIAEATARRLLDYGRYYSRLAKIESGSKRGGTLGRCYTSAPSVIKASSN